MLILDTVNVLDCKKNIWKVNRSHLCALRKHFGMFSKNYVTLMVVFKSIKEVRNVILRSIVFNIYTFVLNNIEKNLMCYLTDRICLLQEIR